jgi:hypothetical protein
VGLYLEQKKGEMKAEMNQKRPGLAEHYQQVDDYKKAELNQKQSGLAEHY